MRSEPGRAFRFPDVNPDDPEDAGTKTPLIGVAVGWEAGDKYYDFQEAMNFHISELETELCDSARETPEPVSQEPLEGPSVERARRRFRRHKSCDLGGQR